MKILVPIKRVIDANVNIRVKTDSTGVETANVKMAMNPFCEIAVEAALKLKESGMADEVIAVSIGTSQSQETLRTALAMGADRAILIESAAELQPLAIAKCLKAMVEKEQSEMVILGKQSIDNDNNQTGQMLAGLLGWAQGTFASKIEVKKDSVQVTREIDGGLETVLLKLPAVVTTDLRLNTPRYATLPNIMKAKKKPLDIIAADSLGVEISANVKTLKVIEPPKRGKGILVASAAELVDKLRNEAKVI